MSGHYIEPPNFERGCAVDHGPRCEMYPKCGCKLDIDRYGLAAWRKSQREQEGTKA